MSEKRGVPNLRFPEFSQNWEAKKLGDLFKVIERPIKMQDDLQYTLVTVKRRFEGVVIREILTGKKILVKSQFRIKSGDFLISKRQIVHCACGIVPSKLDDAIVSNEYHVLAPKGSITLDFFKWYVRLPEVKKSFFLSSAGVHIEKMLFKIEDWFKWKFAFPSLPEQQKIADFLTVIDTRIQQLTRKKALLEQYKKGVMQGIFSREIRFKDEDGKEFGDWEEKRLGEVGEIMTGKTPDTTEADYWDGPILFVTPTDITDGVKYQTNTQRTVTKFKNIKILPPKSIMYTCIASIGKMSLTIKPSITNQQINSVLPNENANNEFLYYSLQVLTPYIKSTQANNTLPIINKTEFSKFKINLPSLPEQQKIADFLTALDAKINHVNAQITHTQTYKKGLLQQMFV